MFLNRILGEVVLRLDLATDEAFFFILVLPVASLAQDELSGCWVEALGAAGLTNDFLLQSAKLGVGKGLLALGLAAEAALDPESC